MTTAAVTRAEPALAGPDLLRDGGRGVALLVGGLLGLLFLVGRWGPGRLEGMEGGGGLQLRFLVAGALLFCLLAGWRRVGVRAPQWVLSEDRRVLLALLLAFQLYTLASALWAPDHPAVGQKAADAALMLGATAGLALALQRLPAAEIGRGFWSILIAAAAALAAVALLGLAAGGGGGSPQRLAVLGGGPNVFGRNMGLLLLVSLHFASGGGRRLAWLAVTIVAGGLIVLSGSRGAMVSTLAGVLVYLVLEGPRALRLLPGLLGAAALATILLRTSRWWDMLRSIYEWRVVGLVLDREGGIYLAGRDVVYQHALQMGAERPFFGSGLAGFRAEALGVYPHNIFLEIFAEGGLVGLALILGALAAFAALAWRHRRLLSSRDIAALVLLLTASQFSGDLYNSLGVLLLLVIATIPSRSRTAAAWPPLPEVG